MQIAAPMINDVNQSSEEALDLSCKAYEDVRKTIMFLTENHQQQPELETIAKAIGLSPDTLTRLFRQWAGLTPKAFLQAVTLDRARHLLYNENMPVLETALELGLSGPARLHDLFVTHEAMPPGVYRAKGAGLLVDYGFHPSPFGTALIMVTEHGLAGLAFADKGEDNAILEDMTKRWPAASYKHNQNKTAVYAERIFKQKNWSAETPLKIILIGTDFEVRVWKSLMTIPLGKARTYKNVAEDVCTAKASRAVGRAVGRNPISFVVPCHRVVGFNGALTGYHWGLTRKRAMLGWEKAVTQA
jgi:AraC family transcriptional regulator of adaptative response/methylated-DNA-[protein]-cysteine methyltransferase